MQLEPSPSEPFDSQEAFLRELAEHCAYWTEAVVEPASDPAASPEWTEHAGAYERLSQTVREAGAVDDLRAVVAEAVAGVVHSVLVTLDGGTALAGRTTLSVMDENGRVFDGHLHELFAEHLE
jgi:hypothetical protein